MMGDWYTRGAMEADLAQQATRIAELEQAIRVHRDARGDDRCWKDDEALYTCLPEGYTPPARDTAVELARCKQFIKSRQHPKTEYVSPQRLIEELEAKLSTTRKHRCSGCDLRWDDMPWEELPGAELCGDCWRKAQPLIHGDAAATARGIEILGRFADENPGVSGVAVDEIVSTAAMRDWQFVCFARRYYDADARLVVTLVCAPDLKAEAVRRWPDAVCEQVVGIDATRLAIWKIDSLYLELDAIRAGRLAAEAVMPVSDGAGVSRPAVHAAERTSEPSAFRAGDEVQHAIFAGCLDCGLRYSEFPLDLLLPRSQWLEIHPADGGLLCAACIVKRAAMIPRATAIHAVIEIAPISDQIEGSRV